MQDIDIRIVHTPQELKDAFSIRTLVFQEEQGVDHKIEFDDKEDEAIHFIVYVNRKPVATARVRYPNSKTQAKVERFAVLLDYREKGIGTRLMNYIENYLIQNGVKEGYLHAQVRSKSFYEKFGYVQVGETFEEAKIPHVKMVKKHP